MDADTCYEGRERTSMSLLACYAVAIITEGILYERFGSNYLSMNTYWTSPQATFKIFGYYLPYIYLLGFALAVLFVVAIYFMLYRTQFGRSVRATMQDHTAARLVGIDVNRVAAFTFGIGVGGPPSVGRHGVRGTQRLQPEHRV